MSLFLLLCLLLTSFPRPLSFRLPLARSGGSGLGLYIARGIVKLHEGCVLWATSPGEGLGSTFYLQFPVATATDEAIDIPLQDHPAAVLSWAQQGNSAANRAAENVENLRVLVAVRILDTCSPFFTTLSYNCLFGQPSFAVVSFHLGLT